MMNVHRLRPVFFRVGTWNRAHSGWIDIATTDIWALADDISEVWYRYVTPDVQTAMSLAGLRPNSAGMVLVPHARLALTLGERVIFAREVDMYPLDVIEAGERGVVGRRDRITGEVEVFLEQHHIKLADYSNTVSIVPQSSEDMLSAIEPHGGDQWTSQVFVNLDEYKVA